MRRSARGSSGYVLLPWARWDVNWYLRIITEGYNAENGTAQFHPLLFWLSMPISRLSGMPLFGLILISSLASLALLLVFERYARLDLPQSDARTATLLLACAPLGFILFVPYTEGLFLLCSVLCLLLARHGNWWFAGVAGAAAVLTRQQGLFLVVPIALEIWERIRQAGDRPTQIRRALRGLPALALVPVGMLIWLLYRGIVLDDVRPDTTNLQTWIYSLLISPSANKVVSLQAFILPWEALALAFERLVAAPSYVGIDLIFGLGFVPLVVLAWPRMRWSERAYTIIIVLVSFAYYTGPTHPYMGLPRHLLLAFPVFIGLAPLVRGTCASQ
ncbi:MAG: hypothetical protein HC822_16930 [Oscillochloris sp.]|nr:hypothetical protein [Oscillochloris sp.]